MKSLPWRSCWQQAKRICHLHLPRRSSRLPLHKGRRLPSRMAMTPLSQTGTKKVARLPRRTGVGHLPLRRPTQRRPRPNQLPTATGRQARTHLQTVPTARKSGAGGGPQRSRPASRRRRQPEMSPLTMRSPSRPPVPGHTPTRHLPNGRSDLDLAPAYTSIGSARLFWPSYRLPAGATTDSLSRSSERPCSPSTHWSSTLTNLLN
mmetsp:Transcript_9338/g.24009  ORF Transcript_9338/g.24009 Transcript_9338/m.24009 type:complete len:205 (-) Transcript_9338:113-727(-)